MDSILNIINNLPTPIALVIRHGARYPGTDPKEEMSIGLTDKGMNESRLLGMNLKGFISARFYHSPALRCRQTAECIMEGIKNNSTEIRSVEERTSLCAPYVRDPKIMEDVDILGREFLSRWFLNELDENLIYNSKESARLVAEPVFKSFTELNEGCIDIHVSHDWDVVLLWKELAGVDYKKAGWPGYLSGIIFYSDNDAIRCLPVSSPDFD